MSDDAATPQSTSAAASRAGSAASGEGPGDTYRITVKGTLDDGWSPWFDGLRITHDANGDTALVGNVRDQAALHGLLAKIRDLGLTLIAIEPQPEALSR
jgi:hypothetical protein